MTNEERPIIQMRPQLRTPEWIRQAKANAAQVIEACDVAQATYNLAVNNLNNLLDQRQSLINSINGLPHGSPRTIAEEHILVIQERIVAQRHAVDNALRDLEALRQEKMRVIR
jgi:hypothetical protein